MESLVDLESLSVSTTLTMKEVASNNPKDILCMFQD
jgi:hypothetical protein